MRYPPTIRLAGLAGLFDSLEGVSSRRRRAERGDVRARGPIPWSASYVAGFVGGAPLEVLRRCVEGRDAPR